MFQEFVIPSKTFLPCVLSLYDGESYRDIPPQVNQSRPLYRSILIASY